jgi:polyhydroxyalkanoate synthesis regulator phasin
MDQINSELKKILMAGIGAVSTGVEKSQQVIERLAQKGEITYEQAKVLSQEAASKVKKAYDESCIADFFSCKVKKENVVEDLKQFSVEDLTWLRDQLSGIITAKQQEQEQQAQSDAQAQQAQSDAQAQQSDAQQAEPADTQDNNTPNDEQ